MKSLKNKSVFLLSLCLFVIFPVVLFAENNTENVLELRKQLMQKYRSEISALSFNEIPAGNLGVWNDILENTLFLLIRKTELYRGKMRVIIEENADAKCNIYPDGTILISTAIFDYIDAKLASTQNISPRKIKNFNIEREKILAAFLVHQVANFIMEDSLINFSKNQNSTLEKIKQINMEADKFALLILKLAAYDPNIFYDHLEELNRIQYDSNNFKRFKCFFEKHFEPQKRIAHLLKNVNETEIMAEEVSSVLESVQGDSLNSLEDAKQKLISLKNEFPNNTYFKRLFALVLHKKWRISIKENNQELLTSYSGSMQLEEEIYKSFRILNNDYEQLRIRYKEFTKQTNEHIENVKPYDEVVKAYKDYLNSIEEAGMLSSYAMLLHYSNKQKEKSLSVS